MEPRPPQSPEVAPPTSRPRRWWDRWPVLIPFVLIGALLWMGLWYSRRAELLEDASHVEFEAPTWAWLEMFAGPEVRTLIGSPTALHLTDGQTTRANLRIVAGFDELTDFAARDMTDTDLEYLADCTKLESLHLAPSSITDDGIDFLAKFSLLENLWITTDQPLTNDSLRAVGSLTSLERLGINTPDFGNVDLQPLSRLRSLDTLNLCGARIESDTLQHVAALPALMSLWLFRCDIGEESLAALRPSLSGPRLRLDGCNITDAHLPAIRELTWLMFLLLTDTQVSEEACRQLKQDRPGMYLANASGERVDVEASDPRQ